MQAGMKSEQCLQMTGIKIVNLNTMIEEIGEEAVKSYLSCFSCPQNQDVEMFLKQKAIEFAKQGLSQTHLVMMPYQGKPVLVGYFTLANKNIAISTKKLSSNLKRRIKKFATHDPGTKSYYIAAPLIAQLGKNFSNGYNKLITGDELLSLACEKVSIVQMAIGGRVVYVECEDKPQLTEFYSRNGFYEFDTRKLERDETELEGEYLVQMLRYLSE